MKGWCVTALRSALGDDNSVDELKVRGEMGFWVEVLKSSAREHTGKGWCGWRFFAGTGAAVSFSLALLCSARADDRSIQEKESFNLFRPTPRTSMRDLATDRPDKTESPYTLDAGHFMHETDLLNYTTNQDGGVREDSFLLMAPNLKVGLTNYSDLQFVYQPYRYERKKIVPSGQVSRSRGSGDLTIRYKHNLWGNDEGVSAGGVMPYVSFPVGIRSPGEHGDRQVSGGLIIPFAVTLSPGTSLGFMTEIDLLPNDEQSGQHYTQWVNTATISQNLMGPLSGYLELFVATAPVSNPILTVDSGITVLVTKDCQLDAGLNVGVTEEADDLNPFLGLTQRF